MANQSPSDRYKAEMPQIPGVTALGGKRGGLLSGLGPPWRLVLGLLLLLVAVFFAARGLLRTKHAEQAQTEPAPQIVLPAPVSDTLAVVPVSTESQPGIATIAELAKPWSSKQFFFRNRLTGENVPAIIVRLPGSSAAQGNSYWAFALQAPFGRCQLEYMEDLKKLSSDYGYRAKHPMVGNPCSRTVFDPTRLTNLPGNVWVRGAMVQGLDIRPPLGIEVRIEGQEILAVRME